MPLPVKTALLFGLETYDLENRSMIVTARLLLDFSQRSKPALAFSIFTVGICIHKKQNLDWMLPIALASRQAPFATRTSHAADQKEPWLFIDKRTPLPGSRLCCSASLAYMHRLLIREGRACLLEREQAG